MSKVVCWLFGHSWCEKVWEADYATLTIPICNRCGENKSLEGLAMSFGWHLEPVDDEK